MEIADHRPNPEQVSSLSQQMVVDGELVKTETPIAGLEQFGYYAPPFFGAEQKLAAQVQQLLKQPLVVDTPSGLSGLAGSSINAALRGWS